MVIAKRRYDLIDPTQIFLSFAGSVPEGRPVHTAIRATHTDDTVRLVRHGKSIRIESPSGVPIGCLSAAGYKIWESRLDAIRSAKIVAMIWRTKAQTPDEYRDQAVVDAWEYPVVEVCWSPNSG